MTETISEVVLKGAAVAASVVILSVLIFFVWKFVASFRLNTAHRPPALCLGLWLLQWPFFLISAAGNGLELLGVLAYNLGAAVWLWRRSRPS